MKSLVLLTLSGPPVFAQMKTTLMVDAQRPWLRVSSGNSTPVSVPIGVLWTDGVVRLSTAFASDGAGSVDIEAVKDTELIWGGEGVLAEVRQVRAGDKLRLGIPKIEQVVGGVIIQEDSKVKETPKPMAASQAAAPVEVQIKSETNIVAAPVAAPAKTNSVPVPVEALAKKDTNTVSAPIEAQAKKETNSVPVAPVVSPIENLLASTQPARADGDFKIRTHENGNLSVYQVERLMTRDLELWPKLMFDDSGVAKVRFSEKNSVELKDGQIITAQVGNAMMKLKYSDNLNDGCPGVSVIALGADSRLRYEDNSGRVGVCPLQAGRETLFINHKSKTP